MRKRVSTKTILRSSPALVWTYPHLPFRSNRVLPIARHPTPSSYPSACSTRCPGACWCWMSSTLSGASMSRRPAGAAPRPKPCWAGPWPEPTCRPPSAPPSSCCWSRAKRRPAKCTCPSRSSGLPSRPLASPAAGCSTGRTSPPRSRPKRKPCAYRRSLRSAPPTSTTPCSTAWTRVSACWKSCSTTPGSTSWISATRS